MKPLTKSPYGFKCRVGDIVAYSKRVTEDHTAEEIGYNLESLCIVLRVTRKDMSDGTCVEKAGLYGFHGMWYGRDPMNNKSYGKVTALSPDFYNLRVLNIDELCLINRRLLERND